MDDGNLNLNHQKRRSDKMMSDDKQQQDEDSQTGQRITQDTPSQHK